MQVFIQIGLAKTEFVILDSRQHCEMTAAANSLFLIPSGIGIPTDMRPEWTRHLVIDSRMFGGVLASEWAVLMYMPNLTETHGPEFAGLSKRVVEDAMRGSNLQCSVESYIHARASGVERTRGLKIAARNTDGNWNLSRRSHLEAFFVSRIDEPRPALAEIAR